MNIRKYILAACLISSLIIISGFTQSEEIFLQYLNKKLSEYNLLYPSEKAYLHTDKTFYKPGDDIWIAGYLTDGISHTPSETSNVLYIKLVDPKGSTLKKQMFKVKDGKCEAHLSIPIEAPGGLYKLKAFTKWMSNFGDKMIFEKDLQVQKIAKPTILSVLDFAKEAYGALDTVRAKLNLRDLSNTPISYNQVDFTVQLNGSFFYRGSAETNNNGDADISFTLPEKLVSSDGILNVVLSHQGRSESISGAIPIVLNKIDLQFMPEGGDAVDRLPCKMAFKALNEFGKPADVEGEIYDSKGEVVTTFSSFHQGMGAFNFRPDYNEVYTAKILKPSGVNHTYFLPSAKQYGCVLQFNQRKDNVYHFNLRSNVQKKIYVVVQHRGEMLYDEKHDLKKGTLSLPISIDKKGITGVAQITVFDDYERPLAERLFYVFPENKLSIEVTTNKKSYAPREKVEMDLVVKDAEGKPVEGNFSLAVVDDKIITFADDKQDNILSSMLLSSDLKGDIYEPSFYFNPKEDKAAEAIDYLLLTQGWRRFEWKDILELYKQPLQAAEKYDKIEGRVTNYYGKGVKAKLIIIDDEHGKYVKLQTNEGGRFSVSNFDDFKALSIFARAVNKKERNISIDISQASPNIAVSTYDNQFGFGTVKVEPILTEENGEHSSIQMEVVDQEASISRKRVTSGFVMQEDAVSLDEVVSIGYGSQRKRSVTGAVTSVSSDALTNMGGVNNALQGRIAGVQVINNSGAPASNSSVVIRGASSYSANNQPLYIIDGVPLTGTPNFNPSDVSNISVLKNASATAVYGSRAANGVILITTKNGQYGMFRRRPRHERTMVQSYLGNNFKFKAVKQFYAPKYENKDSIYNDIDKRETLYWNPVVKTNKNGKAKLEFYNSDEISTFRGIVEGIGSNGLVGRSEVFFNTQKPLSIETKLPPYLVFEDMLELQLLVTNNTSEDVEGSVDLMLPESWELLDDLNEKVLIKANSFKQLSIKIKIGSDIGKKTIKLHFDGGREIITNEYETEVVSKGFPAEFSYSSRALESTFSFDLSKAVSNSTEMSISIYNNVLADMMDGIESVIREPYGCFEQASASTYPNVLILNYLRKNKELDPNLEETTLDYIKKGYKKLIGYETKQNGFEWFGHTPPHEGLTAFGLMEFYDMKQVYPEVSSDMLQRTEDWLLSRRDGKGGFKTNKGKYGFSGASNQVTAAYLVYAFSEVGVNVEYYQMEYKKACKEALRSKDAYRLALMANASLNRGDEENAQLMINHLVQKINKGGVKKLKADHSIVRSSGKSLQVEVAALTAMALMKEEDKYFKEILTLMDYILGARSYGGFGSTQATVLALKSVMQYAAIVNKMPEEGNVTVSINGKEVMQKNFGADQKLVKLDHLEKFVNKGVQRVQIKFDGIVNPLNFTANCNWRQTIPASSKQCKVQIDTQLMNNSCKQNELVRLSATVLNKSDRGLPMTVAMIGIPSGLSPQPWQLKKMQEEHEFAYYEIHKNYVVIYYRELAPNAKKVINLDLKAEVPGVYSSPASCTYLYYTKEYKDWDQAGDVTISQ